LLSIPTAQYLLLRSVIHTARRWIWVNVLAWSLGICWTFAPSPLINASTPLLSLIGIYAMAGLLMATTVAVITGLCWFSWLRTLSSGQSAGSLSCGARSQRSLPPADPENGLGVSQPIGPSPGAGFLLVGLGTEVSSSTSDKTRAVSESPSARSDSRDGRRAPVERNPKFFAKPIARPLSMPTQ
jgi:hypothetical protein